MVRVPRLERSERRSKVSHAVALGWTGIDQLLSSVSNVLISLAVARAAGIPGLGAYTVAFTVYLITLGFQRALVTEPLLAIATLADKDHHPRLGLGAAVVMVLPATGIVAIAGLLLDRSELVALAAVLPFVCLQDAYRHVLFRRRQAHLAAASDGIWVVASVAAWPLLASGGTVEVAVIAWGLGGALGLLLAAAATRVAPHPGGQAVRWWGREARPLGGFLAVAHLTYVIGAQVVLLGLAGVLGEGALGELRAVQIFFGPVGLATTAISFFALPRMASARERLSVRVAGLVSIGSAVLVIVCVGCLFIAAPLLFPILYGSSFVAHPALLVPLALGMVVGALSIGPILLLKARMTGGPLATTRIAATVIGVPIVLVVAANAGLVAAAWAMLAQATLYVLLVWRGVAKSLRLAGHEPRPYSVLGVRVDPLSTNQAAAAFQPSATNGAPHVVHQCNAYNLLLASREDGYRSVMNRGDLNLPDGWSAVWAGRRLGVPVGGRVAGADLCDAVFRRGIGWGLRHFFYGGTEDSLSQLRQQLQNSYPGIVIVGTYAPPFRQLTDAERAKITHLVNGAEPDVVWVGLGTPKQDLWMEEFRDRLNAHMLVGVGAVFDFLSGTKRRAPSWMQRSGLEWLHRLVSEPGRLWRRYLLGNPAFVLRFSGQLARERLRRLSNSGRLSS
jgi:N-acetylglucosaminyldiphosphoundecaprenol N-acetyl-beta-D-mannosaminyltransferase